MRILPVTPDHAFEFGGYRYPAPYDLYDSNPENAAPFLEPTARYFSVIDGADPVGFCCFGAEARIGQSPCRDEEPEILDVGVGMSPSRTDLGQGGAFLETVLSFGAERYAPTTFRASVADFNLRCRIVLERAGFSLRADFIRPTDGMKFGVYERSCSFGSES